MAGQDDFEARNMHDGSPVIHRDKKVSRFMALLLMATGLLPISIGVFVAFANATSQKPVPAAALPFVVAALVLLGVLFFVLGLVFAVVRMVVTERAVHVKYGLWGPRIPLARIRSCSVVDYDWTEFGGFGIRLGKNGAWAYVPSGGKVVEIRYEEEGAEKRVLVGVDHPEETARRISEATRLRIGDRLRVGDVGAGDAHEEEEVAAAERARR